VPPTGKSMDLRACQILEIADGKVKSMRQYFDMASLLNQLGIKA
jgi:ketosteroid isomerase-like protein